MEPIIPRINEEVYYSIEKQMESGQYLTNMAKHIRENNPTIAGFLHSFVGRLPPCCSRAAMLAAFTTYRLIESQVEANKMENELKI
jgi:hypothetical protein